MAYIESVVNSPQFREDDFAEFLETLTFYVISRIRHYKEENDGGDDIPQWLKNTPPACMTRRCSAKGRWRTWWRCRGRLRSI